MVADQAKIEVNSNVPEFQRSGSLKRVLDINRANQTRDGIRIIAERSFRKHLINNEAYLGYLDLADGKESYQITTEMLESTKKFAQEHEERAIRFYEKIQVARRYKIASQTDEYFLMKHLVMDNLQFAVGATEVEILLDKKLDRMKKEKDYYNTMSNHKLIKNIGYLKVNSSTKIDFPKEDDFLKMTVPKRRELLKKLKESLVEAEKYAKEMEKVDNKKLIVQYEAKLKSAKNKRILGKETVNKFMDGFRKIDQEEKEYWLSEFNTEMERYETLWKNIRESLQGVALGYMEKKLDKLGYTELLTKFGQVKELESSSLCANYSDELNNFRIQGIIGEHTEREFNNWMKEQDLSEQYKATSQLSGQMDRYRKLWVEVNSLKSKEQDFMKSKIDAWGYTKLNSQLQAFKLGETIKEEYGLSESERVLAGIRSSEVKNAIRETDELLVGKGERKRGILRLIIDNTFNRQGSKFDATNFQEKVRNKANKFNPGMKNDSESQGEDKINILEKKESSDVIKQDGFTEIKSVNKKGQTARDTQVQINQEEGMERLLSENTKRNYRSDTDGGSDDLSLSIKNKAGATVKLDLQQSKVLNDFLKKREEERKDGIDMVA